MYLFYGVRVLAACCQRLAEHSKYASLAEMRGRSAKQAHSEQKTNNGCVVPEMIVWLLRENPMFEHKMPRATVAGI